MRERRRWWGRRWGRRRDVAVHGETPDEERRRKQRRDAWRSRNAWNHGDPPGVSGLH